jgi:hypothetical protein
VYVAKNRPAHLISLPQLSRRTGWAPSTTWRWARSGKLGRVHRLPGSCTALLDVNDLIEAGYLPTAPAAPDVEPDSGLRRALRDRDFDWLSHLAALAGDPSLSDAQKAVLRGIVAPPLPEDQ